MVMMVVVMACDDAMMVMMSTPALAEQRSQPSSAQPGALAVHRLPILIHILLALLRQPPHRLRLGWAAGEGQDARPVSRRGAEFARRMCVCNCRRGPRRGQVTQRAAKPCVRRPACV